jgi:hypothetical protein
LAFVDNKICLETRGVGNEFVLHFEMMDDNVKVCLVGNLKKCSLHSQPHFKDAKVHVGLLHSLKMQRGAKVCEGGSPHSEMCIKVAKVRIGLSHSKLAIASSLKLSSAIEHVGVIFSNLTLDVVQFFFYFLAMCHLQMSLIFPTSLSSHHSFERRWLSSLDKLPSSLSFFFSWANPTTKQGTS